MDSEKVENPFLLCWKKWKKSLAQERKMIEYRLLYKFLFGERLHMNAILNLICNLIDIFARNLPFKEAVVFVPEFVKERGFLATLFEEDSVEEVKIIYFLWILSSSFPPELAGTENRLKVQRHMPSGC